MLRFESEKSESVGEREGIERGRGTGTVMGDGGEVSAQTLGLHAVSSQKDLLPPGRRRLTVVLFRDSNDSWLCALFLMLVHGVADDVWCGSSWR